jgi:hypothetical protein
MHNITQLFSNALLKHGCHFNYLNQPLNICMCICYVGCHEAGLCCYLVIHIENLLHPLQLFYSRLWPIYWLTLVVVKSRWVWYNPLCQDHCTNSYNYVPYKIIKWSIKLKNKRSYFSHPVNFFCHKAVSSQRKNGYVDLNSVNIWKFWPLPVSGHFGLSLAVAVPFKIHYIDVRQFECCTLVRCGL